MDEAIGVVWFRPLPDFDRLKAIMLEDPREVIAQGKHFLSHANLDAVTRAKTYNLLCYTSACVLKRSDVEAVFHGHEAVRMAREVPGVEGQAILFDSLVNLGTASERIGEYGRAIESYREAIAMPLDWIGRRMHEDSVITYLGRALYYQGEYTDALTAFDQAGVIAAQRQDSSSAEFLSSLRALCYLKLSDLEMADACMTQAASAGNQETRYELRPRGQILASMAVVKLAKGDLEQAESYAKAAYELAGALDDPHGKVEAGMVLACCAKNRRRVQQALELAQAASQVAFAYGYVPLIQDLTWLMGHLYPQRVS